MNPDQNIRSLFEKAGWFVGRSVNGSNPLSGAESGACSNAMKIINEYGDLLVGEVGPGRDMSASDIHFRQDTFSFSSEFHDHWPALNRELFAFATAHHDHMVLLVDEKNDTYIFTDPDEELYFGGEFREMIKKVLLGISYGTPIKKT